MDLDELRKEVEEYKSLMCMLDGIDDGEVSTSLPVNTPNNINDSLTHKLCALELLRVMVQKTHCKIGGENSWPVPITDLTKEHILLCPVNTDKTYTNVEMCENEGLLGALEEKCQELVDNKHVCAVLARKTANLLQTLFESLLKLRAAAGVEHDRPSSWETVLDVLPHVVSLDDDDDDDNDEHELVKRVQERMFSILGIREQQFVQIE